MEKQSIQTNLPGLKTKFVKEGKDYQTYLHINEDKLLGEGSFGKVYLGTLGIVDFKNQEIAIKVSEYKAKIQYFRKISEDICNFFIDSIRRETDLLIKMKHANIIKIYYQEIDDKYVYLFMEKMDGTLEDILQSKQQLEFYEIVNLFVQILNAVNFMQTNFNSPVSHRDIKLQNILYKISKDENNLNGQKSELIQQCLKQNKIILKIADFGSAKQLDENNKLTKDRGTFIFTPYEILKGEFEGKEQTIEVQLKHDTWSLGIVLFRMIYGQYPFNTKSSISYCQDLEQFKEFDFNLLNQKRQIPQEYSFLKDILKKMLHINFKERIYIKDLYQEYKTQLKL